MAPGKNGLLLSAAIAKAQPGSREGEDANCDLGAQEQLPTLSGSRESGEAQLTANLQAA